MRSPTISEAELSPRDETFRFTGRLRSVVHAGRGVASMLRSQHNAWLHATATIVAILLGCVSRLDRGEWATIVLAIVGVWVAEAMNTAFEHLCDVASPTFHPDVKRAKDVAAGAVLISAIGALAIGAAVFIPHISLLLSQR